MELITLEEHNKNLELNNLRRCLKNQKYLMSAEGYIAEKVTFIKIVEKLKAIGYIFLFTSDNKNSKLIDIVISPVYRGKGYGYLALNCFVENCIKGDKIIGIVDVNNIQSQKCFKKCNFKKEKIENEFITYVMIK